MSPFAGAVEALVAVLLLASGVFSVVGALGLLRLEAFFQRMHAPALTTTFGNWSAVLASVVHFLALASGPTLHALLIVILLAVSAPVTTTLLARAALFRSRAAAAAAPRQPEDEPRASS